MTPTKSANSLVDTCGCCEGVQTVTPRAIYNRPGLAALNWRVGEYADFYETLLARISQTWVDVETGEAGAHGRMKVRRLFPLRDLRTRATDDPTIALLDAWSIMADVLTFYTERIANEGYLRTANELRSVIELARLVGYRRRPGVAASVYLAFTSDDTWKGSSPLIVPSGARVQSMPEPDQSPQFFETDAPLPVRPEWNLLTPRQFRPAYLPQIAAAGLGVLYFQGTATNLSANSPLLFVYSEKPGEQVFRLVAKATSDFIADKTRVDLVGGPPVLPDVRQPVVLDALVESLKRRPSIPPASAARLGLKAEKVFGRGSAFGDDLLLAFRPYAAEALTLARANAQATPLSTLRSIQALRVKASVYAHTAPNQQIVKPEQPEDPPNPGIVAVAPPWPLVTVDNKTIDLDTTYDAILSDTWVVIERLLQNKKFVRIITKVQQVQTVSLNSYNFPAKVTRLTLRDPWLNLNPEFQDSTLDDVRSTTIYAAPEELTLADQPVEDPVCGDEIELDRLLDGLQAGRWLIVTGERAAAQSEFTPELGTVSKPVQDDFQVEGVPVSELVMLKGVRQDTLYVNANNVVSPEPGALALPGDKTHTFLQLATPLSYCYKRDTVRIYANVAHATHGETRREVLGSGNGSSTFQTFTLKSAPLTYVAATTPAGIESTLNVYVNDVRWHEAENLLDLGPADRGYLTSADHEEKTSVTFGDGRTGARLPTGNENVRAVYRSGIGRGGNVRARQISQLVTNTDGLRSVINPQRASGGADPEGLESTRARAPLAVAALDRLVSTVDYADFARLFAGIGKASAARLPSTHGQLVQVTVAGQDDIPIDESSDLYTNLLAALLQYGDPYLPVQLVTRELVLLVVAARIRVHPDYLWDKVEPQIRAALLRTFGFERRSLGQDAYAAEAIAAMQAVPGVEYVDLDLFTSVPEKIKPSELETLGVTLTTGAEPVKDRIASAPDRVDPRTLSPLPAQLVILSAEVPTTILLTEVPNE